MMKKQPLTKKTVVPTKLKLKGKPANIHQIMKAAKRARPEEDPEVVEEEKDQPQIKVKKEEAPEVIIQPVQKGSGKIMSSLATVHGKDTNFTQELEPGDKLIIFNEQSKEDEERIITMVLSKKSMGIKEQFSRDLSSFTEFRYQKKPVIKPREKQIDELVEEKLAKIAKSGRDSEKQPPTTTTVEYRTNAGPWTYKKVTEEVEGDLSKEQLLDIRVKKTRDKFCWF